MQAQAQAQAQAHGIRCQATAGRARPTHACPRLMKDGTMNALNSEILRNAHVVLLPAISDLAIEPQLGEFLREGGQAILLGETREEYLARKMSPRRRAE